MTKEQLREEIYRATDSFLVEAKDQNGNDRALERLNEDRHLFVDRMIEVISQAIKEAVGDTIGEIGAKLLAKHSPQVVLDAYFDSANEVMEKHEINN